MSSLWDFCCLFRNTITITSMDFLINPEGMKLFWKNKFDISNPEGVTEGINGNNTKRESAIKRNQFPAAREAQRFKKERRFIPLPVCLPSLVSSISNATLKL